MEKKLNPTISTTNNRFDSGQGYSYDSSGNTTADAEGRTFVYDAKNKQVEVIESSVTIGEYFYDGDGKRVKKIAGSEETIFVYDAGGKLIGEYSTVVQTGSNAKTVYTTNDHLGSPRINTDGVGAVISRHDYHPFGEEIARTGYGSDTIRKQFTGYERDGETGLDFAQARMYSNTLGRFSTPDPALESISGTAPQGWNRYSYVFNSPLRYMDPLGLWAYEVQYEYFEDGDKKGQVKSAKLIFRKTKETDDAASLLKQLGYKAGDKGYDALLQTVTKNLGDGSSIQSSSIDKNEKNKAGVIGTFFGVVEEKLAAQKEYERRNPSATDGPSDPDYNDCSMTSCRLAYPAQMRMRGAGGAGVFANFGVDEADGMNGQRPKAPLDDLRVRDIIRYGTGDKRHFANVMFTGDDGIASVFSRTGVKGRFETLKIDNRRLTSYGKITGSFRP